MLPDEVAEAVSVTDELSQICVVPDVIETVALQAVVVNSTVLP